MNYKQKIKQYCDESTVVTFQRSHGERIHLHIQSVENDKFLDHIKRYHLSKEKVTVHWQVYVGDTKILLLDVTHENNEWTIKWHGL